MEAKRDDGASPACGHGSAVSLNDSDDALDRADERDQDRCQDDGGENPPRAKPVAMSEHRGNGGGHGGTLATRDR